ncbi:helix-turn-helix domain-containing protein [Pseudoclavibacter chungangensis]|uniref:Helix-turn-helix domain-containing protein n=1 Tax=Pseudoclavibacter chungangensis TaxID=587635 RepID=A0A7J5BPR3_9MICO|nr:helix-turn-helix domain-containing protein [Pseudoclavibacter chungangensis]KAB1655075.1 helix-turn-helix domain-containing protein [Pseudoclavibacter chungangensis]NYJ66161.1 DNA-binding IclR family transcriptional regulator [Pseudoclavibacter chungangensis]
MAGGTREPGSGVLERAGRILSAFSDREPALSVSGIASRTGLPRSTVHRIASELVAVGYLRRGTDGYEIGTRLFEIGVLAAPVRRLAEAAAAAMRHLSDLVGGATVRLHVLSDEDPARAAALLVQRLPGSGGASDRPRVGGRSSLVATSEGRALLIGQDDAWLYAFARRSGAVTGDDGALDPAELRLTVAGDRERGHSIAANPDTPDRLTLAVPIRRAADLPQAALGVDVLNHESARRALPVLRATGQTIREAVTASS